MHLWCGVTISLWAVLIGLSGSILVFKDEIERYLHPDVFLLAEQGGMQDSSRASLVDVAEAIRQKHPQHQIGGFRNLHQERSSAYAWIYQLDAQGDLIHRRNVHFNQYTGRILGTVVRYEGFPGWLEQLHFFLLMGRPGLSVNGVMGLLLFLMCCSGVLLWWPGRRRLSNGFTVRWRARWRRRNHDLHRVGGFAVAGLLSLMAITGAYFGLHGAALSLLTSAGGMGGPAQVTFLRPPVTRDATVPVAMPLDDVYRAASASHDRRRIAHLSLPRKAGGVIAVDSLYPGNPLNAGMVREYYHPGSGELLNRLESASQPWGVRLSMAVAPIHFGQWGGLPAKMLWAMLGVTPGFLAVSGLLMWWNRVLAKRFGEARFARTLDEARRQAPLSNRYARESSNTGDFSR